MKPELREALGKAAYEHDGRARAFFEQYRDVDDSWEKIVPELQEYYCTMAEAAVHKLARVLVPSLIRILLSEEEFTSILQAWLEGRG